MLDDSRHDHIASDPEPPSDDHIAPQHPHSHDLARAGSYEEFDWASLDELQPTTDRIELMAEAMHEVIGWFFGGGRFAKQPLKVAQRAFVLAFLMQPNLIEAATQAEIAELFGCTKANISKCALQFSDKWQIRFRPSRPQTGRAAMSKTRTDNHRKSLLNENT